MIRLADEKISEFIKYLSKNHASPHCPVMLTILHGYDTVRTETDAGFGVYVPGDKPVIMIAGEMPEELGDDKLYYTLHTIAHEYMHHIQACTDTVYSEDDADLFADKITDEFMRECGVATMNCDIKA